MSDFDLFEYYLKKMNFKLVEGGLNRKNIDTRSFSGGGALNRRVDSRATSQPVSKQSRSENKRQVK